LVQLFFLLVILSGCAPTLDKVLIYDKTHRIIDSDFLNFNGYYYSVTSVTFDSLCGKKCLNTVLPIFFYKDGTAITSGHHYNNDSVKSYYKTVKHFADYDWGSFKINGKEISVEFYWPNSGRWRYERYQMDGQITGDTITFTKYIERDCKSKNINYKYYFEPFEIKPDSSLSFLKQQKRFNKIK
jgi:hypothetical protein